MVSSRTLNFIACTAAVAAAATPQASAFTTGSSHSTMLSTTILHQSMSPADQGSVSSRRTFMSTMASSSIAAATAIATPIQPAFAEDKESLVADLSDSLTKIQTIPSLVESLEWDKIRTVLKTPPVNQLWNLGESKNTLTKLAKETGDFDLMEMKDELAISLQMTDQYSYDNNFIYYQPGNGKIKTKEPMEMANKAIIQLKEALDVAKKS